MSWASGLAFSLGVRLGVVLKCEGAMDGASVGVMLKVDMRVLLRGWVWDVVAAVCWMG